MDISPDLGSLDPYSSSIRVDKKLCFKVLVVRYQAVYSIKYGKESESSKLESKMNTEFSLKHFDQDRSLDVPLLSNIGKVSVNIENRHFFISSYGV